MSLALTLLLLQCAPEVLLAAGSPSIAITTNYYAVGGTNVLLIRHSLAVSRPFAHTNTFDAFTHWNVRTEFRIRRFGNLWKSSNPWVKATITLTLPRWIPGFPVGQELVEAWTDYLSNLKRHEAGHVQIARDAAEEVQGKLDSLPGYPTAWAASQAAQAIVNETIEGFRVREREYDKHTRHGHAQGAVLRLPRPAGTPGKAARFP